MPIKKLKFLYVIFNASGLILVSQFIQRTYPIIDNHFIGVLGSQALLIHNIYYIFFSIAQYTSLAAATTCLILWKQESLPKDRAGLFFTFFTLSVLSTIICIIPIFFLLTPIINHFHVDPKYTALASHYLTLGLLSTIILGGYLYIIFTNNGIKQYIISLVFTIVFLIAIVTINFIGIKEFHHVNQSLIFIIRTKLLVFLIILALIFYVSIKKLAQIRFLAISRLGYKIWMSELSSGFITAVYPIIFAFQLATVDHTHSMIVTYQLALQLTVLLCIPLMCSIQLNLVQASEKNGKTNDESWWKSVIFTGLAPTLFLLTIALIFNKPIMSILYHYKIPKTHEIYIVLFFIGTMVGQIGNMYSTILRARKKSHVVALIYYVSDIGFLLGLMQIIILMHWENPFSVGVVTLIYTVGYTTLNIFFATKRKEICA